MVQVLNLQAGTPIKSQEFHQRLDPEKRKQTKIYQTDQGITLRKGSQNSGILQEVDQNKMEASKDPVLQFQRPRIKIKKTKI